jgi:hypothetical protein
VVKELGYNTENKDERGGGGIKSFFSRISALKGSFDLFLNVEEGESKIS